MTLKLSEWCIRGELYSHSATVADGSSFCPECLAWLRLESDRDPLEPATIPTAKAEL